MAITIEHRVYTKGDKTALLSITENTVLTIINDESKLCESAQEAHLKLLTLGYKKTDTIIENAPVAPVPDKKYIKGTPEHKAHKESKKPINGHPTGCTKEDLDEAAIDAKGHKSSTGGMTKKGVEAYRKANPGSNLQTAVTTPPSELKAGSKAANRRKSFCARMSGVEGPMKDEKGEPTRKALALKKWNCNEDTELDEAASPIAGTRLVKKYGPDEHRAEVRYNPDYQEYQVHHYKDGKHMGEGPVSYHGDDKQDAHDTAKHEADKRATVKEELEEAHKLGDKVLIHKGSMSGTVGHIGEIRPGMFKGAPKTYTVDYSEPGKESRQSVQVKKEHIKAIKEDTQIDEISKKVVGNYVGALAQKQLKAQGGLKPNMYGKLEPKHQKGFDRAIERLKEDLNESKNSKSLQRAADNHSDKAANHANEAEYQKSENKHKLAAVHTTASKLHDNAAIHYNKAAKAKTASERDYHTNKAGEYAGEANAHINKHGITEDLNEDQKDSITMDIPLLIRVLELVRESVKDDAALHRIVEKLIAIRDRGTLTMNDYNYVASLKEELEISEEQMNELKKTTLASYTQKAALSMSKAAFGQGQAHGQYTEPAKRDVKLFSKRLKGIGTATAKLAKEDLDESAADKYWDKAEEHKAEANKNKGNPEKFHNQMSLHHDALANYHSDIGQSNMAERHSKKAEEHHEKSLQASEKGLAEAVIDPEDKRNPDIPTYLRKQQGQKPLSYAEVKARSTKNVDAYRKRAGVLEDIEEAEELDEGGLWANIHAKRKRIKAGSGERMRKPGSEGAPTDAALKAASESNEIFPELASIVESNTGSSVMFKNGETSDVSPDHANALINLHGMLSDENKQKLAEYAHHSMGNFSKVVDWALTKIK